LCQKPPRLLSETSIILLDSLDDALENPGYRPLPRKGKSQKSQKKGKDVKKGQKYRKRVKIEKKKGGGIKRLRDLDKEFK
jgi:hypothetical protein